MPLIHDVLADYVVHKGHRFNHFTRICNQGSGISEEKKRNSADCFRVIFSPTNQVSLSSVTIFQFSQWVCLWFTWLPTQFRIIQTRPSGQWIQSRTGVWLPRKSWFPSNYWLALFHTSHGHQLGCKGLWCIIKQVF